MQLKGAAIEGFVARPDPKARAVLVYGPDAGLVRERADRLARAVVPDLSDPFRVAEIAPAALKDTALLRDEAAAIPFGGGRRALRIRDAGDATTAALKDFLADPAGDALIVVEAGELPPRSTLRALFEKAPNAAALPCYRDEGRGLEELVRSQLREAGLQVEPEALEWLASSMGGDRAVTRRELEKLILYMADQGPGARVRLADAQATIGDTAAVAVDAALAAAAEGDLAGLDRALMRVWAEEAPVRVLRMAQGHFQRLHLAASAVAAGGSADAVMKSFRPQLFFRAADRFKAALGLWTPERLGQAMARLLETELAAKSTGMPDQALAAQALIEVALMARAGRRRR